MAILMKTNDWRQVKMNKNKNNNGIKSLLKVIEYVLKEYKWYCLLVLLFIIISSVATLSMTIFMQSLIDDYIMPLIGSINPDFSNLAASLIKLAGVLIIGIIAAYAYNRIMVSVSQGTMKKLRVELFSNMESLPIKYFDTHAHGDIMSVYTNDVDTLRQVISQSLPQVLNSFITLVATFISMLVLDIPLTILSVLMVILMLRITAKLSEASGKYFKKQQDDLGIVNGYIEEMMQGQKVVKVFCHEDKSIEGFKELNNKLRESAQKANSIANIMMPVNGNIGNISYVLCAIIGAVFALNGMFGLTIGTLVAFLNLNKNFTMPITQISQQISSIVMAGAGSERVFELMQEEKESDDGYVELVNAIENKNGQIEECNKRTGIWAWRHYHKADGTTTYTKLQGKVTFDDVDFGYNDDKIILHNIKMEAKPGQKIAFVGTTGAGKTTITNLINRFYDIQDGKIRYDDINVNKIKKSDLRRSLGIVLQDTHLFTGTVLENIRYGRLDATDEECIEAAKLVSADGFIRRLPDGYNTMLTSDGANLSQGQRQLIAIARAAVSNPPALILDEATSSIDTRTEQIVQKGMDALMKGRTSFVIAHRLSTIKNSDCIIVMDKGRIIERGSHDELLNKHGKYYQLYTGNKVAEG